MNTKKNIRLYNGKLFCPSCHDCPIVDYSPKKKLVTINDPSKPENGSFVMTPEEYNALIKNAKPVK